MIRINVVAEGQSELFFAKQTLNKFFNGSRFIDSRCVLTSTDRRNNYEYRGGLTTYKQARADILRWMKQDKNAYVTTMFDFYRLPTDFPEYEQAKGLKDHERAVRLLEEAMRKDILDASPTGPSDRFIPYIQLHEFETLLYTNIKMLECEYLTQQDRNALNKLYEETKMIPPEQINHGDKTAPSKRLLDAVDYRKGSAPALWLELITIEQIMEKCPHFAGWIDTLSKLPPFHINT